MKQIGTPTKRAHQLLRSSAEPRSAVTSVQFTARSEPSLPLASTDASPGELLPLEELDRSFVLLCCLQGREGAQILALALLVFLARVEAIAAGRQFADHVPSC